MSPASTGIHVGHDGRVAHVRLGDGHHRNALTADDWLCLRDTFEALPADGDLRLAVVRGAGGTFSSGADITRWEGAAQADVDQNFALMEAAFTAIERSAIPSLAVVEGIAAGAGCELALACDVQIAARSARIGMPIARLGILLSRPFAVRLLARAGPSHTLDLIYTGRLVTAEEAVQIGLLTRVVDDAEIDAEAEAFITTMTAMPIAATRAARSAVAALLTPLRNGAEPSATEPAVSYSDFIQGVDAFVHHR